MRQAAAWTASNLGHPPFEMECILASHDRHAECTRMINVATSQLMTRREDGIRGMDHFINPHNSRDAEHHTVKHVAHLVWLCKKVSLT
jgi:hypothetical protein